MNRADVASAAPTVRIGGRTVGAQKRVFVIAEAGVNHNGGVAMARSLIDAARAAGADAVKFQVFHAEALVAASAPTCDYQRQHDPCAETQRDMLRRLELGLSDVVELKTHADRCGIQFLATPFGLPELDHLVRMNVAAVKIASTDIVNVPLLTAAAASGQPIILSTGASTLDEIDAAVALLRRHATLLRLVLLHCVSAYPTPPDCARLATIRILADRYGVPVGFSDHTKDASFSALAVAAGACVLEKHITLDRTLPGPDHFFALEPDGLARYVAAAHRARAALGDGRIGPGREEQEVRELARGSIVSRVAIPAGRRVRAVDLCVQRPAGGMDPKDWCEVVGRVAATDIPSGARLSTSMLQ